MNSLVTIQDILDPAYATSLNLPDELKFAAVVELERRSDGVIVRRDRWEKAVRRFHRRMHDAGLPGLGGREFEIDQLVAALETLVDVYKEHHV